MKRCLAIVVLSVFLITYLLPVATLVKADVVIGDNDETVVNENAYVLGRKLALMESVPNLLNSGVTQLTISNVDDLDEYLDDLWNELGNAVDYLTSGDWVDDISLQLRNEALENISNYINYVGIRANDFSGLLLDPASTLLKEYVIGNNLPKTEYKPYAGTLGALGSLSRFNGSAPNPSPDVDYLSYINQANGHDAWQFFWYNLPDSSYSGNRTYSIYTSPASNYSWFCYNSNAWRQFNFTSTGYQTSTYYNSVADGILTLYINNVDGQYIGTISNITSVPLAKWSSYDFYSGYINYNSSGEYQKVVVNTGAQTATITNGICTYSSNSLADTLGYFTTRFRNINIYVDGNCWAYVDDISISPTLDIDGFLRVYGNDNPPQYDIQNGTKIDYDMLYDTIYNAIINALPIDQQDITYYDSHDTVYSPTIINNYGSNPDGESDWIESILDYAVVPDFKTGLLAPIETPLVNGMSVMVTVQDTIPNEILYVLGAVFVLLLFVCVINKMTK